VRNTFSPLPVEGKNDDGGDDSGATPGPDKSTTATKATPARKVVVGKPKPRKPKTSPDSANPAPADQAAPTPAAICAHQRCGGKTFSTRRQLVAHLNSKVHNAFGFSELKKEELDTMHVVHCSTCGKTFEDLVLHSCFIKDVDRTRELMEKLHQLTTEFVDQDEHMDLSYVDQTVTNLLLLRSCRRYPICR
jgi:hypothetical protein